MDRSCTRRARQQSGAVHATNFETTGYSGTRLSIGHENFPRAHFGWAFLVEYAPVQAVDRFPRPRNDER